MRLIAPISTLSMAQVHEMVEQRRDAGQLITADASYYEAGALACPADFRDCYDTRY